MVISHSEPWFGDPFDDRCTDEGGKDSCQGDSGGPLICEQKNAGLPMSTLVQCCIGCEWFGDRKGQNFYFGASFKTAGLFHSCSRTPVLFLFHQSVVQPQVRTVATRLNLVHIKRTR